MSMRNPTATARSSLPFDFAMGSATFCGFAIDTWSGNRDEDPSSPAAHLKARPTRPLTAPAASTCATPTPGSRINAGRC
jgi:hypothetical protein